MRLLELLTFAAYLEGIARAGGMLPVNWTFRAAGKRWALRGWIETVPPTETIGPPMPSKPKPGPEPPAMIPPANAGAL
jgi:hypothetical protein